MGFDFRRNLKTRWEKILMKKKVRHFREEHRLFLKSFMKDPRHLGAIWPSSEALGNLIGQCVVKDSQNKLVLEIGAGTGRLTNGLLKAGVKEEHLICVELDPFLFVYLKKKYPNICILEGRAEQLNALLDVSLVGNIDTIVSGIPMRNMSIQVQDAILEACFKVLDPCHGRLLQFTYGPTAPFSKSSIPLKKRCLGRVWKNIPPAFVWEYRKFYP